AAQRRGRRRRARRGLRPGRADDGRRLGARGQRHRPARRRLRLPGDRRVTVAAGAVERMLADVAGLGAQIRASEWAARRSLAHLPTPEAVCIAGLGGSAIGADLAEGLWGGAAPVPIVVRRDSTLPGFVGKGSLVVALSYSGDTFETLRFAEESQRRGAE